MPTASDEFIQWLNARMQDREWGVRETARQAGLSHPTVSDILNLGIQPSYDTCMALARAFNTPPEEILRLAGLLPKAPEETPTLRQLIWEFLQLDDADQAQILKQVKALNAVKARSVRRSPPNLSEAKP
jgi:transcriptional regulator with XRE-family HTH domain